MARNGFDLSIKLSVTDKAVAEKIIASAKNKNYCHNVMLGMLIEAGECTAKELHQAMVDNIDQLGEEGAAHFGKYSAGCHMQYFLNRFRGAVQGTKADGTVVVGQARKATKKAEAKKEEAAPAPAEAAPAEPVTAEEEAVIEATA